MTDVKFTAKDVLKSIFAITGPDNALQYNYGYERIPENWYRRPTDFSLLDLNADVLGFIAQYPELAKYAHLPPPNVPSPTNANFGVSTVSEATWALSTPLQAST